MSLTAFLRVATLNPGGTSTTFLLAASTKYTATLTTAINDAAGNPIAGTTWTFTTGP